MSRKRYPLRVARTAHGIRAQDLRTLVRTAWWARRWIAALEAMRLGPRLGRGRQYAVAGQVTDLMLEGPHVEAQVTGSRAEPYRISLDFTAVSSETVAKALQTEPIRLARLLTDDLPTEVEELLRAEGVPLFPKSEPLGKTPEGRPIYDVKMKCSCPDWARPCKHIVAVLFLLGEEIARHPATLLSLRGVDVDDLTSAEAGEMADPLALDANPMTQDLLAGPGTDPAPFLKRLGPVPFWRGEVRCLDALGKIYSRVHPVAMEAAQGKSIDLR
ncbi:MAG: SWIM zinc finger family protein [Kiritimatiellia bacterium]